jgi:ABC-type xylose transport system substrate-binding protein
MVTITIVNGSLKQYGIRSWNSHTYLGIKVDVAVDRDVEDDFVLNIYVAFDVSKVGSDKVSEIYNYVNNNKDMILSGFGY